MQILERLNSFIWGVPTLILIICIGIYLSVLTGFAQFRLLPRAIKTFIHTIIGRGRDNDETTPFRALCTALAATVGTGNLAGVAGAIAIGGPGSLFWMWICAFLGMVTKYAEVTLAMRFRIREQDGGYIGGPMYMIRDGMGRSWNWLACTYCFLGVVAAFGIGNATQINTLISSINMALNSAGGQETTAGNIIIGIGLAVLTVCILSGGAKRIGRTAEQLVPFASLLYILLCLGLLVARYRAIPNAIHSIIQGAFYPQAVTGGVVGSVYSVLRVGASRGVFTNEAGMGTASIAHCTSAVQDPREQGLMGIMEVFLDTIVICSLTGIAILCSGAPIRYGIDTGVQLTTAAFSAVYGNWIGILITLLLCCFSIATVIGWGLYGECCARFLFGRHVHKQFVALEGLMVVVAAVMRTDTVWILAEMVNGLMAIPNLLALAALSKQIPLFAIAKPIFIFKHRRPLFKK